MDRRHFLLGLTMGLGAGGVALSKTRTETETVPGDTDGDTLTWETEQDWDNAIDESYIVHDAIADRTNASLLVAGYPGNDYGGGSLEAWWPFYEDSGSAVADLSGNARDMSLTGTQRGVTGIANSDATYFDGADDYANAGDLAAFEQQSLTVTYWYNSGGYSPSVSPDGLGSKGYSIGAGGDRPWYLFYYRTSGVIETFIRDGSGNDYRATSTTPIDDGEWHFVAHTIDGSSGTVSIHVDGVKEDEDTGVPNITWGENTSPLVFMDHNSRYTEGTLDEARFYSRALSESEISDAYSVGGGGANLTTGIKSFDSPSQPDLQNLFYSLNNQTILLDVIGSPGTTSEEVVTQTLDGASEYPLTWSNGHTEFNVRVEFGTSDPTLTPTLNIMSLVA